MKKIISVFLGILMGAFLFAEKPIVKNINAVGGKGKNISVFWMLPENSEIVLDSDFIESKTTDYKS